MIASGRLYLLLLIGLPLYFLTYINARFVSIGLAYDGLLLALVLLDCLMTPTSSGISAVRTVAERLSIGRQNEVKLLVLNATTNNLQVRVKDDFPQELEADVGEFKFQLARDSQATLRYNLLPRRRGSYEFHHINIRYLSRLGLLFREAKVSADRSIKVYSDLQALKELSVKLSHSTEIGDLKKRRRGHGTEFASLRDYVSGDDTRKIDWKATARRERPVIRMYEVEQEQTLMILLDAGRMMASDLEGLSRFDHALNAALSLALTGLHRNDQVGFGIFADKPLLFLPPRRGKAHLNRMLDASCAVQSRLVEPDYQGALTYFASAQKSRSLMVVLTDLSDPMGSQTLLAGLASLSPRHLPFCVTLRDRQIDQVASNLTLSDEPVYRRAVATDLIVQRELSFSHLVRRGCLVLDCPPQELSEKLVDRYLEIKARGRL